MTGVCLMDASPALMARRMHQGACHRLASCTELRLRVGSPISVIVSELMSSPIDRYRTLRSIQAALWNLLTGELCVFVPFDATQRLRAQPRVQAHDKQTCS